MRIRHPLWSLAAILFALAVPALAEDATDPGPKLARVMHVASDSEAAQALDVQDRHALALTLVENEAAAALLDDRHWPRAIAAWLRARLAEEAGDTQAALRHLDRARRSWTSVGDEYQILAADLDREHLRLALLAERVDRARAIAQRPLVEHQDDVLWLALRGALHAAEGDLSNAALRLDEAWERADRSTRGDPLFRHRALVHLRGGDPFAAAEAWLEWAPRLTRPEGRRAALATWDAEPRLVDAIRISGARAAAVRWLGQVNRREDALALAREGWEGGGSREAAACFVLAAEQLYRLRRHEELAAHLTTRWPPWLDDEQRAALLAYPWGVQRRSGASVEIARGFDDVIDRYPGTGRAIEALWESAWMWELSAEPEEAAARFQRYAQEHANGAFAKAAALRALYLAFGMGKHDELLRRLPRVRRSLGRGQEEASALWLAARSADALGRTDEAARLRDELEAEHPDCAFVQPPGLPLSGPKVEGAAARDTLIEKIYRIQKEAFETIAAALGVEQPFVADRDELRRADLMLRLGMFDAGEAIMASLGARHRRDVKLQLRLTAIAWKHGRPERQSRSGYQLMLLLRKRGAELRRAGEIAAYPTPYTGYVLTAADALRLPAGLLWGLIRRESFYDADVVSAANAHGLMQLLPSTAARLATAVGETSPTVDSLRHPELNIRYGTNYLRQLLDECGGNPYQALASYNAGEANGRRWRERVAKGAPMEEMLLIISYSETRAYVHEILRMWRLYGRLYPPLAERDGLAMP